MKEIISVGLFVIFLGFMLVFIGALTQTGKADTKLAIGGFIGFIPFGFANDKRMLYTVLGLSAVMFVFVWILLRR